MFLFCLSVLFCFETGPLCSPGYSGALYVEQDGLELTEILLSLPPECWDWRHDYHTQPVLYHFIKNVLETNWEVLPKCLFFCWFGYIYETGFISFLSILNVCECVCVYLCMSVCVGSCVFMFCTSVCMPRTPGIYFGNTVHLLWGRVSLFWEFTSRQDWLISEPQGSSHHLCLPRAGITSSYRTTTSYPLLWGLGIELSSCL